MSNNHDDIKNFAVRMTVQGTQSGSGIIVKPTDDNLHFYVLTARHNFKSGKSEDLISDDIIKDNTVITCLSDIKLNFSDFYIFDRYDLAIFYFNEKESIDLINSLPMLSILDSEDDFSSCRVIGFPKTREQYCAKNIKASLESFNCVYAKEIGSEKYELKTEKKLYDYDSNTRDSIQGLSGGGVIVTAKGKNFLVGIQLGVLSYLGLACLDLRLLVDDINHVLKNRFHIKDVNLHLKIDSSYENVNNLILDVPIIDFSEILTSLENEKIYSLKEQDTTLERQLEIIKKDRAYIRKVENDIKHRKKELAETLLYYGAVCYTQKDYNRATRYFNKAIEYNSSYSAYLYQAKKSKAVSKNEIKQIINDAQIVGDKKQTLTFKIAEELIKNISEKNELAELYCMLFSISYNEEISKQRELLDKIFSLYQEKGSYADFPIPAQNIIYLYLKGKSFEYLERYLSIIENNTYPERDIVTKNIFLTLLDLFKRSNDKEYVEFLLDNIPRFEKFINITRIYLLLANSFYENKQFENAKNFYQRIIEIKCDNSLILKIKIRCIYIAQNLGEPEDQIKQAYQKAKDFLEKNRDDIVNSRQYDNILEKIWWQIKNYTIDDYLAANRELKENITNIQNTLEPLTKQSQLLDDKINIFEQRVQTDIHNMEKTLSTLISEKISYLGSISERSYFQQFLNWIVKWFRKRK